MTHSSAVMWSAQDSCSFTSENTAHFVGPASNWTILIDGTDFTLIDTGYPADLPLVLASIAHLGLALEKCQAILITHAHVDHTGSAAQLAQHLEIPILCSEPEKPYLQGYESSQVTLEEVFKNIHEPKVAAWAEHAIGAGGKQEISISPGSTFRFNTELELPGRPTPIHTPGHSPGHTAFWIPEAMSMVTGDALVTGHAISSGDGPQMLHPMFHHDLERAQATFDHLMRSQHAHILPGHGYSIKSNTKPYPGQEALP